MPPFQGARGTGNIATGTLRIDMANEVAELEPDSMPLLVFSKAIDSKPTGNADFKWQEDDNLPRFDRINNGAGYASGATSLVVDNGTYFQGSNSGTLRDGDLVYVSRTGEVFRVDAVSTNTLTVTRGVGGGAAALVDNDELIILGSAAEEGTDDKAPKSQNPTELTNYCQIFRTPLEETETLIHSETETSPDEWDRLAAKKGIEHGKDIEYSLLLGRPSKDVSGTHPRRTTGGAYFYVTQNQTDAGGNLTEAELFSSMRSIFRYSKRPKLGLASMFVVDVINGFPRAKLQISQAEKVFGIDVIKIISPHGTINLVSHPLLEGDKLGNEMLYLDTSQIKYRYLKNKKGSRNTHIRKEIQPPGRDSRKDEYMSECGLQFGLPKTHGKLTNVTS